MDSSSVINLDANASVPVLPCAVEAMTNVLRQEGNPSSPHRLGRALRAVLDQARDAVAGALGGEGRDVFFNSGASEGNRWLVDAIARLGCDRGEPLLVAATPLEHASLSKPLRAACARGDIRLHPLAVDEQAELDLADPRPMEADVVFATAAHNETGRVIDWAGLAAHCRDDAVLIADAAQAMARLPVLPKRVDAIVASAHKAGGIAGCGAVLLRGNAKRLSAPWHGGAQEAGLRPGTEATALIAAFGAAAAHVEATRAESTALAPLRDHLERQLLAAWPHARVVAGGGSRLPNTTCLALDGVDGEALRIAVDQAGVCVGFGSACSSLAPAPSGALLALGLSPAQARATMRLSLSHRTTKRHVEQAITRLIPVGR
ncbi:MAG: aminotransferase class V-fold PLP-dependent enzyme [Myxococcota bacterium]